MDNEVTNPVEEDIIVKDVFYTEEPTISIDGKKVDKNDILLYKITYTNADGSAAAVTITDAIPQYTEYVDSSADNGGVFAEGKITWNLRLDAGESKTVSFKVTAVGDDDQIIINQATGLDGENTITTEQITNTIKEDVIVKDVFHVAEPTVSIDNQMVEKNDILLYKVTYTNSDDFDGTVTITDAIPQYTEYVEGSADNNGVFAEGKLTWTFELPAGESKTVSFKVKVVGTKITVENQANAVEGNNSLDSNIVRNPVEEDVVVKEVFAENEPTINIDGKKPAFRQTFIKEVSVKSNGIPGEDFFPGMPLDFTLTFEPQ